MQRHFELPGRIAGALSRAVSGHGGAVKQRQQPWVNRVCIADLAARRHQQQLLSGLHILQMESARPQQAAGVGLLGAGWVGTA